MTIRNPIFPVIHSPALGPLTGRGGGGPTLQLSSTSVPEDATVSTVVGTLSVSNLPDGVTVSGYSITADPDSKFDISSDDLITDATLDYETATSHSVTIEATLSEGDPVSRPFTISVVDVEPEDTFDALISALFAGGKRGVVIAPWDLDTLFQERTGASATTPSTVGDAVGTIVDYRRNGQYYVAVSDAKRGVLRQTGGGLYYIEFDGLDDGYQIASLTLGTSQYEWVALDQAGSGDVWFSEHSPSANDNPGHYFHGSNGYSWRMSRSAGYQAAPGVSQWANGLHVIERRYTAASDGAFYEDGVVQSNGTLDGTVRAESDVTDAYNIGCRNQTAIFFGDKLFGHVLVDGANPSSENITAMREILAEKAGVTLS